MEIHGIKFFNRTKIRDDHETPDKRSIQFWMFAEYCNLFGVNKYVMEVDYTSNTCCFHINADPSIELTDIEGVIALAADKSLPQFELFGQIGHKGMLGKESEEE